MPYVSEQNPSAEQAELPTFVRRCRHRNPRSVAASEKLGTTVSWTTRNQEYLASLLEVTHSVVSYDTWPGSVTVRTKGSDPFDYWPQMGVVSEHGTQAYVDVVGTRDEDDRRKLGFEPLLEAALRERGIRLVTVRDSELTSDPRLDVSHNVGRYAGWPVYNDDVTEELLHLLRSYDGTMTLGALRDRVPAGERLVAQACVMVMRRRLRLSVDRTGFDASMVQLIRPEQRA